MKSKTGIIVLLVFCGMLLAGCTQFWDDASAVSPEGGFVENSKYRWQLLTSRPDPWEVLAKSQDADLRARALRSIGSSSRSDNDRVLQVLETAAVEEKNMICRLAAAECLGNFKNARARTALKEAYYHPNNFGERNAVVRIAALRSLGEIRDAGSVPVLTQALVGDLSLDVRVAAARSLGQFDNYQSTQALVQVLRQEKDVALRTQAGASLNEITGKDLPAQAAEWDQYFKNPDRKSASQPRNDAVTQAGFPTKP